MEITYGDVSHSGTKGMRWGVRRYQNADGSLTDAGKKRYARDAREKEFNKYDETAGKYFKTSKKNGRTDLEVDAKRYVKEDMTRSKKVVDETKRGVETLNQLNDKAIKNTPKTRLDLSNMSDKELRDRINRELLERQYNDVFNPPQVSKGRERAKKIMEGSVAALTVTSSAVDLALSIKELTGK